MPTVRNWIPSILSLFPVQKWRPWQKCRDSASPRAPPPGSLSLRAPPLHSAGFPRAESQGRVQERVHPRQMGARILLIVQSKHRSLQTAVEKSALKAWPSEMNA